MSIEYSAVECRRAVAYSLLKFWPCCGYFYFLFHLNYLLYLCDMLKIKPRLNPKTLRLF